MGIVFVDLNGLKNTNDSQGHKAGDKMIRNSASFLRDFFGAGKVFRTGGDEFNVLLAGVTEEEFQKQCVRFMEEQIPAEHGRRRRMVRECQKHHDRHRLRR